MDTKNTFDLKSEENFKHFNPKNIPQKPLTEKTSPNQKKNNNNIQMSYYFPNNNSLENSEKDLDFSSNLNSLQDSLSKLNLKINNENIQSNNYNMYEKPKNEQDNFMFYGQNPNFNKSPPTNSQPNFKQNPQSFQSNYPNNSNTPNINYFNNYPQNPNQNNILVPPSNQIDYQGPEFPSNKMNFPVQNNQYNNMNNNNPSFYEDDQFMDSNINTQKEKTRNNKKNYDNNNQILNYQLQNKNYSQIARFFVIKSVDEDNIHKSIKFRIWCSTFKGNQKLQKAFKEAENGYPIYLFFSVNGSGRFLGLAQMTSEVDYHANFNYWSQGDKWKGFFFVVWLIIKDVPNKAFRHIINEYNEGKPITSSRDTQEIHPAAGMEALKIFKEYPYESSILDDFQFYEKKQGNFAVYPQQQGQQSYYNNMGNMGNNNINNSPNHQNMQNFSNIKTPQNYNQFNVGQQNIVNEDFYQKINMKEFSNSNNSNNTMINFNNKNQNLMKKEQNEKIFQQSSYSNNN